MAAQFIDRGKTQGALRQLGLDRTVDIERVAHPVDDPGLENRDRARLFRFRALGGLRECIRPSARALVRRPPGRMPAAELRRPGTLECLAPRPATWRRNWPAAAAAARPARLKHLGPWRRGGTRQSNESDLLSSEPGGIAAGAGAGCGWRGDSEISSSSVNDASSGLRSDGAKDWSARPPAGVSRRGLRLIGKGSAIGLCG